MKIIFCIFVSISSTIICNSQILRRTLLVGGSMSGNFINRESFQQVRLEPNPLLGLFIRNNLCLGVSFPVEYTYTNYRDKPPIVLLIGNPNNTSGLRENKSILWNLSPFIRGYFGKKSLQIFTQGEISIGRRINQNFYTYRLTGSSRTTSKGTDVGLGAGVGINYLINSKLRAEALLSYKWQYEAITTDRLINPASNIGIRFGLVALLSKP